MNDPLFRRGRAAAALAVGVAVASLASATPTDDLRDFVKNVRTGHATFTQTVTAPDGKQKRSTGSFDFARPSRFRFVYEKPFAQTVVGDGVKVWIYDPDLNQVSSRKFNDALGTTPAALLVSSNIDGAFTLADQPAADGLSWVQATPKQVDGSVRWLKVGFRDHALARLEIADSFGQTSVLVFDAFKANAAIPADTFAFVPPKGADVVEQ